MAKFSLNLHVARVSCRHDVQVDNYFEEACRVCDSSYDRRLDEPIFDEIVHSTVESNVSIVEGLAVASHATSKIVMRRTDIVTVIRLKIDT